MTDLILAVAYLVGGSLVGIVAGELARRGVRGRR